MLESPRVITDASEQVISRRDFMPFGEQLAPDATYRTASLKYDNGDNIRQKFTGYERDEETGLDFAEARYYNNKHGRFTAIDPLLASGKSANPQTFNRYVYTMNRPLILTDSTGMQTGVKPKVEKPQPKTFTTPAVKIEDNDRNESIIQIQNYGITGKALNGEQVLGGDGKPITKGNGKSADKEYGIIANVSYQAIFARDGIRPDEGTKVKLREDVTETLDGKPGGGYSREIELKSNEDGNSFYGGDIVGLTNSDPDGQGPSTKVYKAEQKLALAITVNGKDIEIEVRTNSIEVNMEKNTIDIKETTKIEEEKRPK